jgi:hypothetical protein
VSERAEFAPGNGGETCLLVFVLCQRARMCCVEMVEVVDRQPYAGVRANATVNGPDRTNVLLSVPGDGDPSPPSSTGEPPVLLHPDALDVLDHATIDGESE